MEFLLEKEVCKILKISRATLYRLCKSGSFPDKRQISTGRIGWLKEEVNQWIQTRPILNNKINNIGGN